MQQRTNEWYTARVGKITASRIKDLNAKPQKGKALNATLTRLLSERLTGQAVSTFTTSEMAWGIECEPLARQAYELATFCTVVETGLIDHPTIAMSGANSDTHTNTLLTGQVPSEYLPQIAWQLACTGRNWCDFVSFDPRMPASLQLKIIRVNRSDVDIETLERDVMRANEILEREQKKLFDKG